MPLQLLPTRWRLLNCLEQPCSWKEGNLYNERIKSGYKLWTALLHDCKRKKRKRQHFIDCQVRTHHNLMCVLSKSFQLSLELPNVDGTQHIKKYKTRCLLNINQWHMASKYLVANFVQKLELASLSSVQSLSCVRLCDPMNRSTTGLPVHHHLPEFTQTHVHRVRDVIQPSHPLSSPSSPAPNPSQHQSLFQWVNSSHEVAKVLELQL